MLRRGRRPGPTGGRFALALLLLGCWIGAARADFIYDQLLMRDPSRSKSDDRRYALYIPSSYDSTTPLPLVVALHGCHQTERMVADKSRLEEAAERDSFIVAYPYIARSERSGETNDEGGRNPRCWGFWFSEEIHRGNGEVGDIARLVDRIKSDYRVDPRRVHVVGLSSGGAMATAALIAYPDVFASGAILDGVGYAETAAVYTGLIDCNLVVNSSLGTTRPTQEVIRDMRTEMGKSVLRQVPVLVLHNRSDCTVPLKVGQAIVDQFGGLLATENQAVDVSTPLTSESGTTGGIAWTHRRYGAGAGGESLIETFYLDASPATLKRLETRLTRNDYLPQTPAPNDIDRGHAWFGARRGPWFVTAGPITAEVVASFFRAHPLALADQGRPRLDCLEAAVAASGVLLECSATDDGSIASYHIVMTGPEQREETLPGGPRLNRRYEALPDGEYTATITARDDQANDSTPATRPFRIGVPPAACVTSANTTHLFEGRAHSCGFLLMYVCANGSNDRLGFNLLWSRTSVMQTRANGWKRVDSCP